MGVSRKTYIHQLISEAGGTNIFADLEAPYPTVSPQQIAEADPWRIFLSSEPFPFKDRHIEELSRETGLPATRFDIVDGELLSWHGSFTEAGLRYADELLSNR